MAADVIAAVLATIQGNWVAVAALGISILTFVYGQRENARRAKVDYVDQLEQRVADCERGRARLEKELAAQHEELVCLRDENVSLMRRVVGLERGTS